MSSLFLRNSNIFTCFVKFQAQFPSKLNLKWIQCIASSQRSLSWNRSSEINTYCKFNSRTCICINGYHTKNQNHQILDRRLKVKLYLSCQRGYHYRFYSNAFLDIFMKSNVTKERKKSFLPLPLTNLNIYSRTYATEEDDLLSFNNKDFLKFLEHLKDEFQSCQSSLLGGGLDDKTQKRLRSRMLNLKPVVEKISEMKTLEEEVAEITEMLQDEDKDMKALAEQEVQEAKDRLDELQEQIFSLLIPVEATDDNDVIVEFSAGVGGQEAMLFTADIFNMYENFAAYKGWQVELLDYGTSDLGGIRHAVMSISGHGAYKWFKFEAGVHRVQRVPKTEKSGRLHTSTMTVAVLPQPKEIDVQLSPKDLRIETKRASGAGGQHVNTTDSAVRIVHLPTGITAESQQERSQQQNRIIAMTVLKTRIYQQILERQKLAESSLRKQQVGSSARSDKIRTYNFAQNRISDHRLGFNFHDIDDFLSGGKSLEDMVEALAEERDRKAVENMVLEFLER